VKKVWISIFHSLFFVASSLLSFSWHRAASPLSSERLDRDDSNQAKAKAFVGTRDAKIEWLENEGSLAAHLDWDKCKLLHVFFSSSRPSSTKGGISTINPTNTWGSAHWENSNFSHMGKIVLFFTQNWEKQQHLGLYLLQIVGEIMYSTLFVSSFFQLIFCPLLMTWVVIAGECYHFT